MLSPTTEVHSATKRIEEFNLIDPSGRWHRFRKLSRAHIWENRAFTTIAIVGSAVWWFILLFGLWRALS